MTALRLSVLPGDFAVVRLPATAALPDWALASAFLTWSKTPDESSLVCESRLVPLGTKPVELGWRCLKVEGPLDFALTGILAQIATPLADAKISIFALSTYDTDYVLVRGTDLGAARSALSQAGLHVSP